MPGDNQLGFGDSLLSKRTKTSRLYQHLAEIDGLIDWPSIVGQIDSIDQSKTSKGGRPRKNPLWMTKAIFLQHLFNLSDPQLEDQLIDRLSFQRFVGINLDQEIPDFTTFWRFKEALAQHNLDGRVFEEVCRQLEGHGLIVKKGSLVDAAIFTSSNRPLSKQKREELEQDPSSQIDTDAASTKKGNNWYFGYKGHIGVDAESKLIRKAVFTPANAHDSTQTEKLVSYDEKALFGDKAYFDYDHQHSARQLGWFYGVQKKADRGERLSSEQKKRNKKLASVRAAVEHPFGWMKTKAGLTRMRAKTEPRNRLRFMFNCIGWNLERAGYLIKQQAYPVG